jgi:hypothetical protein
MVHVATQCWPSRIVPIYFSRGPIIDLTWLSAARQHRPNQPTSFSSWCRCPTEEAKESLPPNGIKEDPNRNAFKSGCRSRWSSCPHLLWVGGKSPMKGATTEQNFVPLDSNPSLPLACHRATIALPSTNWPHFKIADILPHLLGRFPTGFVPWSSLSPSRTRFWSPPSSRTTLGEFIVSHRSRRAKPHKKWCPIVWAAPSSAEPPP